MKKISVKQLKKDLAYLLETAPDNYARFMRSDKFKDKYGGYIDKINELTPLLADPYYKIKTKVYWVLHDIKEFPKCQCEGCHNVITRNVVSAIMGYSGTGMFCCNSCAQKSGMHKEKMRKLAREKYGCDSIVGSPAVRAKIKAGIKRGMEKNPNFYADRAAKSKKTCLTRYGTENPQQNREIHNKTIQTYHRTMLEKYGYDNALAVPEIRERIKQTNIEKYGAETSFQNPEIQKHIQKMAQTDQAKQKRSQTVIEKFGVCNSFQTTQSRNAALTSQKTKCYNRLFTTNVIPNFSLQDYLNIKETGKNIKTVLSWHCKECGRDFDAIPFEHYYNKSIARCFNCHPVINNGYSKAEKTVLQYVKEILQGEYISENDKTQLINPETGRQLELDIFIPSICKAIEFQGTYWHSLNKQKKYDIIKMEECRNNGIMLLQLDEEIWVNENDKAKQLIFDFIFNDEGELYNE